MRFPEFEARSLQGRQLRLPRDLPAERTLVLLPFHQWQQRQVDAWIARATDAGWAADLAADAVERPHRATIEVPCISRRWGPARRFIDGGMATGIRIPTVLARTWTAYTDVGKVQQALGIPNSDNTWVGVVDASGEVLSHTLGDPAVQSWQTIREAMSQL